MHSSLLNFTDSISFCFVIHLIYLYYACLIINQSASLNFELHAQIAAMNSIDKIF